MNMDEFRNEDNAIRNDNSSYLDSEDKKIILELLYDMIEQILSPREYQIYTLSKRMKPRHIADKLGLKSSGIRTRLVKINNKINNHKKWLIEKVELRGLVI